VRGPEQGAVEPRRWQAARADLSRVLSGKEDLQTLMTRRMWASPLPEKPLPGVSTKVAIDNDSSREHSVIDVFTADRVGLLYKLARTLSELSLSVHLARISTEGHRAADSFYVRTVDGRRLEGDTARAVAEAITAALGRES
jgi:[protein-PII] uridylyltransferase